MCTLKFLKEKFHSPHNNVHLKLSMGETISFFFVLFF